MCTEEFFKKLHEYAAHDLDAQARAAYRRGQRRLARRLRQRADDIYLRGQLCPAGHSTPGQKVTQVFVRNPTAKAGGLSNQV